MLDNTTKEKTNNKCFENFAAAQIIEWERVNSLLNLGLKLEVFYKIKLWTRVSGLKGESASTKLFSSPTFILFLYWESAICGGRIELDRVNKSNIDLLPPWLLLLNLLTHFCSLYKSNGVVGKMEDNRTNTPQIWSALPLFLYAILCLFLPILPCYLLAPTTCTPNSGLQHHQSRSKRDWGECEATEG